MGPWQELKMRSCAQSVLAPFGCELLSADETKVSFSLVLTPLHFSRLVLGFWIYFETLKGVVLITGPLIPILCG